ncbi:MAG: hypothetical protein AB3X44_07430 [Leptothrix sp. (in: b-proteobacteria)]
MNFTSTLGLATKIAVAMTLVGSFTMASAEERNHEGQLSGTWVMAISGFDGCGYGTKRVEVKLEADLARVVPATVANHTNACGNTAPTNWTFQFIRYDSKLGSGHAVLGCGPGCGWEYEIQVDGDANVFSMVDVAPQNPGNYQSGIAIRQRRRND